MQIINHLNHLICSSSQHLQFAEGTKSHLCIVERNCPTPVRRRFSLTQKGLCRIISDGEGPGDGINVWVLFCHSVFHLRSAQKDAVVLDFSRLSAKTTLITVFRSFLN